VRPRGLIARRALKVSVSFLSTNAPTVSKWLLSRFLACGLSGGPFHAKLSGRRHVCVCTRRDLLGKAACPFGKGIPVEFAGKTILNEFEGKCSWQDRG
jgi:hypothetical protein